MMCVAPVSRAAMIAESPTAPDPYTTMDDPAKRAERVQHRPGAGGDPAGQRAEQGHVRVVGHLHERVRGADRVRRERGLAEEVAVQRRPVGPAQRRRPVAARPGDHQRPELQAVPRLALKAVAAFTAPRPADDHLVAWGHAGHPVADRRHEARALVPEHAGRGERHVAVPGERVGVADTGRDDLHKDLAGAVARRPPPRPPTVA